MSSFLADPTASVRTRHSIRYTNSLPTSEPSVIWRMVMGWEIQFADVSLMMTLAEARRTRESGRKMVVM
jgi:hypothetical protein